MKRLYTIVFFLMSFGALIAQNPRIKIDYKATKSKIESPVVGFCSAANTCEGFSTPNNLEIRVRTLFKSSTGPSNTPCNNSSGILQYNKVDGWSCEYRVEVGSGTVGGGTCGVWYNLSSQNTNYPGDPGPGYIDTSAYPCTDILAIRLNGYEADNGSSSAAANCNNISDGACGGVVPYGTPVDVTAGSNVPIDIGSTSNSLLPFKGLNWSSENEVSVTDSRCTSDGITIHYYSKWRYRWCWDSTTLSASHAGLIKFPDTKEVCSGASVIVNDSSQAFEAARGFSEYQWQYSIDGTTWSNIAGATTKDLSTTSLVNNTVNPISYILRRAGLFCADFKTSGYRMYPVYTNTQLVIVYPQPASPIFYSSSPGNGTTICKGTYTYAQFDPGTGGYTDANDEFQYSINGGTTWNTYIPGASINTSTATTSVQIRGRRTAGSLTTCTPSSWAILATWPVSTQATPASISTSSPNNNVAICTGDNISANFNAGAGGTGDEYRYSIDNGTTWNTYTPGANINTTSASGNVFIQTRRSGSTPPCLPSPWTAIGYWPVATTPISPTLNTQAPVTSTINVGDNFQVSANSGSGGAIDANDEYRYSTDAGSTWNVYSNNASIPVPSYANQVIVQGRRLAGNSTCANSNWSTLTEWTVNSALPVQLSKFWGVVGNTKNSIFWETSSELNTDNFILLKSVDMIVWDEIAQVKAVGNSTVQQRYEFLDNLITSEISYYKLKIIDNDLTISFSSVIALQNKNLKETKSFQAFPNPFDNKLYIQFDWCTSNNGKIQIINSIGRVVLEKEIAYSSPVDEYIFETQNLPVGTYFIRLQCGENSYYGKIVKQQ